MTDERIVWRFYGYVKPSGVRDVQEWFDSLSEDERDDAKDVLAYLQVQKRHLWREPRFESFDPEISEIKFKANVAKKAYRIYGTFWPEGKRLSYTFLIGRNKKVNNDRHGKQEAQNRLKLLRRGEASVHEFKFEKESDRPYLQGHGSPPSIC